MACFLPATAANPLAPAIELTRAVPEALVVVFGALLGIALLVVFVVLSRRKSPAALQTAATQVVIIPPYPVAPGPTWGGPVAPHAGHPRSASSVPSPSPLGFVPSSALSARAFAKIGYTFGERGEAIAYSQELDELEELASSELCALETGAASAMVPPPESIPCMLESFPQVGSTADETGPMSAVTVTPIIDVSARRSPSSSMLAAAPIADLDLDDAPTELCEPFFDEPPKPLRRGAPPKIRPIPPAPPRSKELRRMLPSRQTSPSASLPLVTTPPAPSVRQPRS